MSSTDTPGAAIQYKPKYQAVRDHLEQRISHLNAGDQLPTEPVLCKEYGVSRITLRRAVEDLIRDGLLVREQGRGTFVTQPVYIQQVRETFAEQVTGFHRQQSQLGRDVSTTVLKNHVVKNATAAEALGLPSDSDLIELERLRYVEGFLHQHVVTYLSADAYPLVATTDFSHGSLFDFLRDEYGVKLTRNDLLVRLETGADSSVAELLGVKPDGAYMAIDSTVFSDEGPVAYGVARHTQQNSEIAISMRSPEQG